MKQQSAITAAAMMAAIACAAAVPTLIPSNAVAQANPTVSNVIPEGGSSAVSGKVESIDPKTRTVTVTPSSGQALPLVAPANVAIDNIEPGDKISAHYTRSVAFLVVPAGAEERSGRSTATVDQTARPAGGIGPQATEIRGAVTKINGPRSFDVVDSSGGGVFTIQVTDPARAALVQQLKVGDRITVSVGPLVLTSLAKCGPFGLICG